MEAGFRLQNSRIAIIGLGLMGGSLAMALKGKCAALYGIDSDPATLELALEKHIVDQAGKELARLRLLPQADIVILATPLPAIIDFIDKLPSFLPDPCIVLDIGSTKKTVLQAMSMLPERFEPLGAHPICGKEKLGLQNAEPGLFRDAPFVITPLARTTPRALKAAEQIVSAIGSRLIQMDAESHDRALAFTSHLPYLLSSALVLSTPQDFGSLVGTGFKSTGRLAGTPSHMTLGVLKSNRENILDAIQALRSSLDEVSSALRAENYTQLEVLLNQSSSAYHLLTQH